MVQPARGERPIGTFPFGTREGTHNDAFFQDAREIRHQPPFTLRYHDKKTAMDQKAAMAGDASRGIFFNKEQENDGQLRGIFR